MLLCGKQPLRENIVLNNYVIKQVKFFKYLVCDMSYNYSLENVYAS